MREFEPDCVGLPVWVFAHVGSGERGPKGGRARLWALWILRAYVFTASQIRKRCSNQKRHHRDPTPPYSTTHVNTRSNNKSASLV